jgi:hypothetical protein
VELFSQLSSRRWIYVLLSQDMDQTNVVINLGLMVIILSIVLSSKHERTWIFVWSDTTCMDLQIYVTGKEYFLLPHCAPNHHVTWVDSRMGFGNILLFLSVSANGQSAEKIILTASIRKQVSFRIRDKEYSVSLEDCKHVDCRFFHFSCVKWKYVLTF